MKKELPRPLEGKGRPIKKERRYLTVCKENTSDTDRTFFKFGPPANPRASKYLNFLQLIAETGRALTFWDLHQLCTGYLPDEVPYPTIVYGTHQINPEYNESIKALCRYGYLRKLAYGRRGRPGHKGRPRNLYTITEKGRQSLIRFEGQYWLSPYYPDTYRRIMDEKTALYDGTPVPPFTRSLDPGIKVFDRNWIWSNPLKAQEFGIKLRPWRV